MSVLIFANGQLTVGEWVFEALAKATIVLAADGGANHLYALGIIPDTVIGDQDSLLKPIAEWLSKMAVPRIQHPPEKDETDLELAIQYAVDNYDDEIVILGALGGRADHMLANMMLLTHPSWRDRSIKLLTHSETIGLCTSSYTIDGTVGDLVSLIPVGGDVTVKATSGLKWELRESVLTFGFPRGISNVMTAPVAEIAIKEGALIVVHIPPLP